MSVSWDYYDKDEFQRINEKYLPKRGEGDNRATQAVTAVNKLVYKWYNDGDVFDNTWILKGWCNDLSSYANWLYNFFENADEILCGIESCADNSDYEDLLAELADLVFDEEELDLIYAKQEKIESVYECSGPFRFGYEDEDEDDEW